MSESFFKAQPEKEVLNGMDFMIDAETLGTVAGSPVVTIGAVLFDPFKCDSADKLMSRALNIRIDIGDAIEHSIGVDGGTVRWWFEQKDEAIKALVGDDAVPVKEALMILNRYCHERGAFVNEEFFPGLSDLPPASRFWAKDPDFDMVLMRYYYEKLKIQMPWKFYQCRSVRTVQDMAWPDPSDRPTFDVPGVAHDAKWDAVVQAMLIQAGYLELGLSHDQVEFSKYQP